MQNSLTAALLAASFAAACGDDIVPPADKLATPEVEVIRLHFILRPDAAGRWNFQDDADHASLGVRALVQAPDHLEVTFDRRYTYAGTVQVTSDDQFGQRCSGHPSLGIKGARITIWCNGQQIDPATIRSFIPRDGNLWVNVTMVNTPPTAEALPRRSPSGR